MAFCQSPEHVHSLYSPLCKQVCSVCLIYWYKRTNTDAAGACPAAAIYAAVADQLPLLLLAHADVSWRILTYADVCWLMLPLSTQLSLTSCLFYCSLKCCGWGVACRCSVHYLCLLHKRTNTDSRVADAARHTVSVRTNRRLCQQNRDSRLCRQIVREWHQVAVAQFTFFMTTLLVQTYRYWRNRHTIHSPSFVHVVCTVTDK